MDTNLDHRRHRGPRGPYRRHSIEFKRTVVEQSLQPGASVSRLARQHDVNANQIFAWRKAYQEGRLGGAAFVPIILADTDDEDAPEMLDTPAAGIRSADDRAQGRTADRRRTSRRPDACAGSCGAVAMIVPPAGTRIWIAAGITDMRRGFDGLAALVQTQLQADPFSGQLFVFRGRRGDRIKVLWWDGDGLCLFAKRLEHGKFVWPQVTHGTVALTPAQLSMLLEGIDWRRPVRTAPNRAA